MEEIESLLASRSPGISAGRDRYREVPLSFWDLLEAPLGSSTKSPRSLERDEPESGLEAESSPQSIRKYLAQLRSMNDVARCPILAVTGLLNAGKSSIVASFLSETGRKRVLIGQSNHEGTHRFVLWVPETWRSHTELWQRILQQLEGVFGVRPEVLSEDAQQAARQYNGEILRESSGRNTGSVDPSSMVPRDPLATPLIATDRKLNDWGLALMDCPDIQTGLWLRQSLAESVEGESSKGGRTEAELSRDRAIQRGRALNHAMQLCSAFIVVAPANGLHEALIEELLQAMQSRMPDIHRILVVNRVPRKYSTSQIASDVQKRLSRFLLHRVYMAYHFEGPHQRDRIPDMERMGFHATESPFPACFRIDQETPPQPPEPIAVEDFLVSIGSHYDMGRLMATCRASTIGQLKNEIELHFRNLSQEMVERQKRVTRLWQTMADACFAFSVQTGEKKTELRLHASREIILQYSASLERTAPWWAKPGRYVIRIAQSTKDWVTDKASLLKPMGWLESKSKETIDFVQGKIRRGEIGKVVSANTLSDALQNSDLRNDLATSDEELDRRSQSMINRFQIESRTRLDDGQVDRFTSEIWGQMGWKSRLWHGLMPATLAFAPLLAVIAIPIDFGGASVLVLASMKELFVAGFLGAGLALWNKDGMPKIAEENAAWQQLSDLFAIGCDQLGLPRPEPSQCPTIHLGAVRKQLSLSSVACPSPKCDPIRPLPIELNPSFLEQVRSILHQLQQEVTG